MSCRFALSLNQTVFAEPSKGYKFKKYEDKEYKAEGNVSIRLFSTAGIFIERRLAVHVMALLEKVI